MKQVKQVILIRQKFPDGDGGLKKLRTGKYVAQGSHASMAFLTRVVKDGSKVKFTKETKQWLAEGTTKICLKVETEEQLIELFQQAKDAGLKAHLITDAGHTEFGGVPTKTAVAIGPNYSKEIDKLTSGLKLM